MLVVFEALCQVATGEDLTAPTLIYTSGVSWRDAIVWGPLLRYETEFSAARAARCGEDGTVLVAHYLDSETAIAAYLTDILEANDAALLASALGDIARARGMAEIAKTAGITREALYKALRPDSAPRFDTVSRVCAALGVRLVAQPVHSASAMEEDSDRCATFHSQVRAVREPARTKPARMRPKPSR